MGLIQRKSCFSALLWMHHWNKLHFMATSHQKIVTLGTGVRLQPCIICHIRSEFYNATSLRGIQGFKNTNNVFKKNHGHYRLCSSGLNLNWVTLFGQYWWCSIKLCSVYGESCLPPCGTAGDDRPSGTWFALLLLFVWRAGASDIWGITHFVLIFPFLHRYIFLLCPCNQTLCFHRTRAPQNRRLFILEVQMKEAQRLFCPQFSYYFWMCSV